MARDRSLADRVVALLLPLGPVEARAMFGGWGVYLEDAMFALIARNRLFIKADPETRDRFAEAGSSPFTYQGKARPVEMSYWEAPAGSLDSSEALLPWAELGVAAAKRAQAKNMPRKGPRPPRA